MMPDGTVKPSAAAASTSRSHDDQVPFWNRTAGALPFEESEHSSVTGNGWRNCGWTPPTEAHRA
jgi:hypothetical protein